MNLKNFIVLNKTMSYFNTLPNELLIMCSLEYFSPQDIIKNINILNSLPIFSKQYIWKKLWQRDISTVNIPSNITYEMYRYIIEDDEFREAEESGIGIMNMDRIAYLAGNGYDILLYELIDSEKACEEEQR